MTTTTMTAAAVSDQTILAIFWWTIGAATITVGHNLRCEIEDAWRARQARRGRHRRSAVAR